MVEIKTIDELEALYYGYNRNLLRKADAPMLTSTAGVFNAIFGAYAWAQLNMEANAFGVLPKYPWDKSGWRVITAKADSITGTCITAFGGTPEGGAIADTEKPTLAELEVRPKTAQLPFSASEVMEWLSTHSKDDIWGGLGSLRLFTLPTGGWKRTSSGSCTFPLDSTRRGATLFAAEATRQKRWVWHPRHDLAFSKFFLLLVRGVWARSTLPATRSSSVKSPSKPCPKKWLVILRESRGSSARRAFSPR